MRLLSQALHSAKADEWNDIIILNVAGIAVAAEIPWWFNQLIKTMIM